MEIKAAIRTIRQIDYYLENFTDDYGEKWNEALSMAIEALKIAERFVESRLCPDGDTECHVEEKELTGSTELTELKELTEMHGTFDAANVDLIKLFGEVPKSICDIDVIGLLDKTNGKKREFVSFERVGMIIDEEACKYFDYIIGQENGNSDKQIAATLLSINIREAVLALKGVEQE